MIPTNRGAIVAGGMVVLVVLGLGVWKNGDRNESTVSVSRIEDFYGTGELRSRSEVLGDVLNGLSEGWYTNGQLQVTEYYVDNISHGLRTKWYKSGQKKSEAQIVHGQIHGTYTRWYEEGGLAEVARFNKGVPDGKSIAYYPSGSMKARVLMAEGEAVEQQFWDDGESPDS